MGMKKKYPTYIDAAAFRHERIYVSAGQRGVQLIVNPQELADYIGARRAELTK